jgi:DNA repair protein RadC
MSDGIHSGHRKRVRDRYVTSGLDSFEDYQLLELLLFYCCPRKDTNALAHKMLNEFGNLYTLFEADPVEITRRCEVSENVGVFISLIPSVARRYFASKWDKKITLDNSRKVGEYAISLFVGRTVEVLYMICLNGQSQLIHTAKISEGTLNESRLYVRDFVETAIKYKASSVILAHNHPSGSLVASSNDIRATSKVMSALETVSIAVLDHIIVAGEQYMSFSEQKILAMPWGG